MENAEPFFRLYQFLLSQMRNQAKTLFWCLTIPESMHDKGEKTYKEYTNNKCRPYPYMLDHKYLSVKK